MAFCCHFGLLIAFFEDRLERKQRSWRIIDLHLSFGAPWNVCLLLFWGLAAGLARGQEVLFPSCCVLLDGQLCFLLTLLLFVLLLDWTAASRQLDMPFLNVDYQHIFPSLSEPGCNVLNLWRCAVNLSVKTPLMLWSSLTFLSTMWEFWSCLWKPARSHLVSTDLPRLWWVIWTLGFCSSLM